MNLKELLQKQGGIYKDLPRNETIEKCNETIEKPFFYENHPISKNDYEIIKELEDFVGGKFIVVEESQDKNNLEISIENNRIIYLRINRRDLIKIPESINGLTGLQELSLGVNKITEIKNLDNLQNLKDLWLDNNKIIEINGLDNLTNLQKLCFSNNKITKIKNLDNLANLRIINLLHNPIKNEEEVKKLTNKVKYVWWV